jgi:hypothetical protein
VIAIDLVTEASDRLQLVIEGEDLVHIADPGGVNLNFEHKRITL